MEFPSNLKYTEDHEWISVEGNIGTIGITEYAQGELGDVVFVDINPDFGDVSKGQSFGTIEAVKTVSDLFAPCTGKLISVNEELSTSPELVNSDPYGKGWMVRVEIKDVAEINGLLSSEDYKKIIGK
jgi:glycine cleavage system H protein